MATFSGSPISVDELPTIYALLSASDLELAAHLAISPLLFYEILLTLDQEIEFIWRRPWKPSTVFYVFIRYFGTVYNLILNVLMLAPKSPTSCNITLGLQSWGGCVVWWAVQGILQMRLYALYHCSKKLLVFMTLFYLAEIGVMMWILIASNLLSGQTIVETISFPGQRTTDLCGSLVITAYSYIWVPCLAFDSILAILAIWAGIKQSRQQSHFRSPRLNRPRIIDVLIQGNVIYFLSPLVTLILLVKHNVSLKVQWFADTLLFRAPVTILVGCRLVLSIREATRPPASSYGTTSDTIALSTVIFHDGTYGGEDSTHCS